MNYPLLDINQNFEHQKKLREGLNLSEQIYVYSSAAAAVQEVLTGLLQFLPHKKSIAIIKGNNDLIHWVMPQLYRQNYQVQIFNLDGKEDFVQWFQNLKSDISCVLFSSDHPITGEELDLTPQALQLSVAKRIPVIQLNSYSQVVPFSEEMPHLARIHQLPSGQAIVQASPRFRFYAPMHLAQPWSEEQIKNVQSEILLKNELKSSFQSSIQLACQKNLPPGYEILFSEKTEKINLFHPELGGDLVLKELDKLGPTELPLTTQFCSHGTWTNWSDWWIQAPAADVLRGLISCPYSFYSQEDNWKKFHQAVSHALKRQSWF